MRLKGKLKSWNDGRGFGFIEPIKGGPESLAHRNQDIFVHITAFDPRSSCPQINELLWFEIELGPEGKKRAKNVQLVHRHVQGESSSAPPGIGTLVAIPAFVLLYIVVTFLSTPPLLVAAIYIGISVVTFLVYAQDKSAAQQGARRTPEATLHLLACAGGWPGALLAQQLLRHKSRKSEFLAVFWLTVTLNVTAFVLFCSPLRELLLAL